MIFFRSDYSQGAHPKIMEALNKTNLEHTDGYGLDPHCENAAEIIREMIGREDANVHMMVGGTPCNVTFIAAALRPYQSVIALRTGHAYYHETGAVEGTGHRIVTLEGVNGKMTADMIDIAFKEYEDEHTPEPKLVYISQPTEIGSIYSKAELTAISAKCKEKNLYLYIDGARLGAALTSDENDVTVRDLAELLDGFYIGGTKLGALFGEALVIMNPEINDHFRYMIKRQNGLLAKGRLIGVQMETLLEGGENSLLYSIGRKENELARMLRDGLKELGLGFYSESPTNQIFPLIPTGMVEELEKEFFFYRWAPEEDGMIPIRLVIGWGTEKSDVQAFLDSCKRLIGNI